MMNKIFAGMICVAAVVAAVSGRLSQTGLAAFEGAASAVELSLSLLGAMCLWTGLMKIIEASGLSEKLCLLLRPVLRRLFPGIPPTSPAMQSIAMNMTANILGLANAATPLGLKAMSELDRLNGGRKTASNEMCTFVILNTASIQLIPATLLALRLSCGSGAPFEIVPPVWLTSLAAVIMGLGAAKLLQGGRRGGKR